MTRRTALRRLGLGGMAMAAAACSAPAPPAVPTAPTTAGPRSAPPLTIAMATSELVLGPNRISLGLIGPDNQPIADAEATVSIYQLEGTQGTKRAEVAAPYRWLDLRQRGVYVARTEFDRAGPWGLEVVARPTAGAAPLTARVTVDVRERGAAPMIGDRARATRSMTAAEVTDLSTICSAAPPCSLHAQSIEAALKTGRPSLLVFATPGFCSTITCAPQLNVVLGLAPRYAGRAELVHIEIFKEPRDRILADAVAEWQLMSEPWIFVVDRGGVIRDRFEGMATAEEITASLDAVV